MSYLINDRAPLPEAPSNNTHTQGQQEEMDHTVKNIEWKSFSFNAIVAKGKKIKAHFGHKHN